MYPGVLDDIQRLFPAARITSGYRGPNNPLTRRNPNSAHAHGSPNNPGAVDVAPIPGVGFNDYVSRLKSAGIPVTGALDEQTHPVAWTTGPNWHVSLDTQAPKVPAQSPYYKPAQDMNMAARAANFGINLPPDDTQPNLGDSPLSPQINTQAILGNLPALKASKGPLGLSKNQWGAMLAALGDSIYKSMGVPSNALGGVEQNIQNQQDNDLAQQRLAQQVQLQRERLMHPPQTQTDRYLAEIMDPNTDPRRKAILRQIIMRPIAVPTYGQDGSQTMQFYYPDSLPGAQQDGGDDEWEYNN
jgi:hypothetical protein